MPRPKKQHLKQRKDGRYCAVYKGIQFMGQTEAEALQAREEYKRKEHGGGSEMGDRAEGLGESREGPDRKSVV